MTRCSLYLSCRAIQWSPLLLDHLHALAAICIPHDNLMHAIWNMNTHLCAHNILPCPVCSVVHVRHNHTGIAKPFPALHLLLSLAIQVARHVCMLTSPNMTPQSVHLCMTFADVGFHTCCKFAQGGDLEDWLVNTRESAGIDLPPCAQQCMIYNPPQRGQVKGMVRDLEQVCSA